jgi:V/A-type H+-transporting ATPase subunit D
MPSRVPRQAATLGAVSGNLERLYLEYRRATRRARALQDVLLPELDRTLGEIEARLEELEQEDALGMRRRLTIASQAQRIEE